MMSSDEEGEEETNELTHLPPQRGVSAQSIDIQSYDEQKVIASSDIGQDFIVCVAVRESPGKYRLFKGLRGVLTAKNAKAETCVIKVRTHAWTLNLPRRPLETHRLVLVSCDKSGRIEEEAIAQRLIVGVVNPDAACVFDPHTWLNAYCNDAKWLMLRDLFQRVLGLEVVRRGEHTYAPASAPEPASVTGRQNVAKMITMWIELQRHNQVLAPGALAVEERYETAYALIDEAVRYTFQEPSSKGSFAAYVKAVEGGQPRRDAFVEHRAAK